MRLSLLFAAALCFTVSSAYDVQGNIKWNSLCPNATTLGHAKVVLDDGKLAGAVRRSGQFVIPHVPAGTYVLSVVSHDHVFDQLRLDVPEGDAAPAVSPYIAGTPLDPPSTVKLPYPIKLQAVQRFNYYTPPESFNIIGMLSNPMALMMVFGGVMMFATPWLMKNMDPEALEDLKHNQAQVADMQNAFTSGDIKGGLATLMGAGGEPQAKAGQKVRGGAKKGGRR